MAAKLRQSARPRNPIFASPTEAHELMAHAGPEVIKHLQNNVDGIHVSPGMAPSLTDCDTYVKSKMTEIISCHPISKLVMRLFHRIMINLV